MSAEPYTLLLLIIIANGAPIFIRWIFNDRFNLAVDFDKKFADGNALFGASKTWRGIIAALLITGIAAAFLGHSVLTGILVASYAVSGDLASSFIKRRLSMQPSSMAPLLDQVPESLLPALMMQHTFKLDWLSIVMLVLTFVIIELVLSHILYRWGLRKRPY